MLVFLVELPVYAADLIFRRILGSALMHQSARRQLDGSASRHAAFCLLNALVGGSITFDPALNGRTILDSNSRNYHIRFERDITI